ncbi:hypothetical protein [Methylibium petroleiphilum]|uniref:Uncharacterized protein n=1 Tax=Methylibium petroleiphilum (strain ATCC BAA-1232 / LMG 22953 / PM1) TaxID=420662 RepID=A2SNJ2_METPP|nr:hypothetical protein [Methylibium petroleiphilum]ABM97131.1 hypothetical protein Mpe_B0356 [Methylibium petroleiphilum PM1]
MSHAAAEGSDKARRLVQSYRRARRKLYQRRQLGDDAVGEYLAQSHVARRLTGIESRRPAGIDQVEISQAERDAFRRALRRLDDAAAEELGGQSTARVQRLQRALDRLPLPSMQDLLRRLYALGGRQVITFGFADDSHRRVVLTPGGAEIPDDGQPHTPLVDLVRRAFTDIHGCIIVIRTEEGDTVNVYEARGAGFHSEPRREIYAAAVIGHVAVYFDAEQARESLETDPRTMTPLPRVPGTVYCDWPELESTEQGSENA